MVQLLSMILAVLVAASGSAAPIIFHSDDTMDSPQPTAALEQWEDAQGRVRVSLHVPGSLLRGYEYVGADARAPMLLVFGGSGNLIKSHDASSRGFAKHASRVVLYDYRGYGFSSGQAHFEALQSDAVRIFDSAKRRYPKSDIVILGFSMGTDIAAYVATLRSPQGLILAAPWSDFAAVLHYQEPTKTYHITPQAAHDFDEVAMVSRIHASLLVFQGTKDNAIPPSQGPELERQAASDDKRFVAIVGAKHARLLENPQSQAAVAEFLATLRK